MRVDIDVPAGQIAAPGFSGGPALRQLEFDHHVTALFSGLVQFCPVKLPRLAAAEYLDTLEKNGELIYVDSE